MSDRRTRGLRPVRFYFDFVSPYSWLALMHAERLALRHGAAAETS